MYGLNKPVRDRKTTMRGWTGGRGYGDKGAESGVEGAELGVDGGGMRG